jgi:hypothetical protein
VKGEEVIKDKIICVYIQMYIYIYKYKYTYIERVRISVSRWLFYYSKPVRIEILR